VPAARLPNRGHGPHILTMDRNLPGILRLVVQVGDPLSAGRDLVGVCLAAEQGGATAILLGPAVACGRELAQEARVLLTRLRVPLLLSSRADVALAVGAAGVHLDAHDVPVPMIRRIAPRGFLIGASVETVQGVEGGRGADYWAIGPWRGVGGMGIGPAGFGALVRRAEGRPCLASGAAREDLGAVLDAGGVGILLVKSEK